MIVQKTTSCFVKTPAPYLKLIWVLMLFPKCMEWGLNWWVFSWFRLTHSFIYWNRFWDALNCKRVLSKNYISASFPFHFLLSSHSLYTSFLPSPFSRLYHETKYKLGEPSQGMLVLRHLQEHWPTSRNYREVGVFTSLYQCDSCHSALHTFCLFIHDVFSESLLCATNIVLGARDTILSQREHYCCLHLGEVASITSLHWMCDS